MQLLLVITYTLFFIYCIQKLRFFDAAGVSRNALCILFALKIMFGFGVWAVYTYYYRYRPTADVFKYFDAGNTLFEVFHTNKPHFFKMLLGIDCNGPEFATYYDSMNNWNRGGNSSVYNDNRLIIRVNALLHFFSMGYFHVHTIFFSFMSFVGTMAIYKSFVPFFADNKKMLLGVLFLIPSVLFWSSGVLKEGLLLFALGLFFYSAKQWLFPPSVFKSAVQPNGFNQKIIPVMVVMLSLLVIATLKFYVLLCLIPSLLLAALVNISGASHLFVKYTSVLSVTVAIALTLHLWLPLTNPLELIVKKQQEFIELAQGKRVDEYNRTIAPAGSVLPVITLKPTLHSVVYALPKAIKNAVLEPLVWNSKSPIILCAAIENTLLLLIVIFSLLLPKPFKDVNWYVFMFCFSFAFLQLVFIGLTTPVVGAVVRYRVLAHPFLLMAFMVLMDVEKVKKLVQSTLNK